MIKFLVKLLFIILIGNSKLVLSCFLCLRVINFNINHSFIFKFGRNFILNEPRANWNSRYKILWLLSLISILLSCTPFSIWKTHDSACVVLPSGIEEWLIFALILVEKKICWRGTRILNAFEIIIWIWSMMILLKLGDIKLSYSFIMEHGAPIFTIIMIDTFYLFWHLVWLNWACFIV